MPSLDPRLIRVSLSECNQRLMPSQRYSPADLDDLSLSMAEDLDGRLSPERFRETVKEYRRRKNFVPTSADLLEISREMSARPPRVGVLALPEQTLTDDDVDRSRRRCQEVLHRLSSIKRDDGSDFGRKPYPVDANDWERMRERWNGFCADEGCPEAML